MWLDNTSLEEAVYHAQPGQTYSFYSIASDNVGNHESAPLTADAQIHVNAPPTISTILNKTTDEDVPTGAIAFAIGDIETEATNLVVTVTSSNPTLVGEDGLVVGGSQSNRTLTITPKANQFGTTMITVSVSDGLVESSRSFMLTVQSVNDPPGLTPIANRQINEGVMLQANPLVTNLDLPPDTLTFSLEPSSPAGVTIDGATGKILWTPSEGQGPGTYPIAVRVTDDGSPPLSDVKTFTVTVREVNEAPTLTASPNKTINEQSLFSFLATAADADLPAQSLTFSLDSGSPEGATIDPLLGLFSWTPSEAQGPGSYPVTVRVTDNGSPARSAVKAFTLTVNDVNQPPIITAIANRAINEGSTLGVTSSQRTWTYQPTRSLSPRTRCATGDVDQFSNRRVHVDSDGRAGAGNLYDRRASHGQWFATAKQHQIVQRSRSRSESDTAADSQCQSND